MCLPRLTWGSIHDILQYVRGCAHCDFATNVHKEDGDRPVRKSQSETKREKLHAINLTRMQQYTGKCTRNTLTLCTMNPPAFLMRSSSSSLQQTHQLLYNDSKNTATVSNGVTTVLRHCCQEQSVCTICLQSTPD